MHVARRVPCEEGAVVSSVGTMFADGRFVSQQCKNHCRGPHRPDVHSCHSICREKDVPVLPALQPITEDPGTCDIVKATQYGMLERCKELVEAGYDVRQADKENVTLLHWAAISNRQELVKQGHLPMVTLLLKCGADPSLIDGEGFSSIHLAVLFQHVPIVAYLVSKCQVRCHCPRCYFLLRSSWLCSENALWNLNVIS
ncbi:palmitoyltransferase ZDHHC13-like isoform X1 [Centrocercus urophasianus]|uniref:palmitoyltransferase ZDHHC13-like isoform X1 n=1 Tax=Centrocercus urophasianus TaxID=9002 RepID=UPI001C65238C|nr:palmitoyltransferase ZDHHC13-like isoform X1 [Centrocercus urophasianus]